MKLLSYLIGKSKQPKRKTIEDYRQELLSRTAREQFRQLAEKGLTVPVVLL